ncbi:MAG TPA: hypothetical protein VFW46_18280 [Stellaceae bacterium]|nr:hypothetical protein [Stellaceae bacterium]
MDDVSGPQLRAEAFPNRPRIATLADTVQRRPIFVLLGMHRSGTSLCSNVLSVLGVNMADEISVGAGNDRGHWERWEIVGFHDRILELFNRVYLDRFHDFPLPAGWWADPRVCQIREEIVAFLRGRMGDAPFGFKDPRTVRLLPMWRQIFAELKVSPRFVFCLRNPAQVARSLHERDGLDPLIGEYRWLVHVVDFFRYIGQSEFSIIEYDNWFTDAEQNVAILDDVLNSDTSYPRPEIEDALADIIDPELRHDGAAAREAADPFVRQVYQLVRATVRDPGARVRLQELVSQFVGFDRLHRPFYREFESAAAIAERLPAAEDEIGNLRNAAGESSAALEAANARADAGEDALNRLRADFEAEREMAAGRDAAAERAIAEARAEIEAANARLAEIETERDAAAARALGAEQAFAETRAEIETERDAAAARAAGAEEALAETRAEIEATRLRLAEIEAERDAATARAAGIEHDLAEAGADSASLRVRLDEIEGERDALSVRAVAAEQALVQAHAEVEKAVARTAETKANLEAASRRARVSGELLAEARGEVEAVEARIGAVEAERDEMARQAEAAGREAGIAQAAAEASRRDRDEIHARLTAREGELFDLHRAESERAQTVERLEQELGAAQSALTQAQRSERELGSEAESLRTRMAAVSDELAASRHVNAALLAALRDTPVPLAPPPRETWFAVLLRRVGLRSSR